MTVVLCTVTLFCEWQKHPKRKLDFGRIKWSIEFVQGLTKKFQEIDRYGKVTKVFTFFFLSLCLFSNVCMSLCFPIHCVWISCDSICIWLQVLYSVFYLPVCSSEFLCQSSPSLSCLSVCFSSCGWVFLTAHVYARVCVCVCVSFSLSAVKSSIG